MTSDTIDNRADIIDSRDIIARIAELQETEPADLEDADREELRTLLAVQEEAEGYAPDWRHGEALIRDSHFEEYARQLADDLGLLERNATWPHTCIDWERAAKELQMDYTSIDFDGVDYWIRS